MIQRIQTVYLLLVVILSFVCLISSVGYFTCADEPVATFSNFTFSAMGPFANYESAGPFALGILLIMVILLSILSIMLFLHRMRQLRLTIISNILLFGYAATYCAFAYFYKENLQLVAPDAELVYHMRFATVLPVICFILNCLAIHGIRKDEALIRSLDRLR